MEGVAKGNVKEEVCSLRRCWGTFRQRAGLSGLVGQDLGKYSERGCSRKTMCLRESMDEALLHLGTKIGYSPRSHRIGSGGKVS